MLLEAATAMLALVATDPIDVQILDVELQRAEGFEPSWYNKVSVQLASPSPRTLHLCPGQVTVSTSRLVDGELIPVDTFRANGMSVTPRGGGAASCRNIRLVPGEPQRVTFFVQGVPGDARAEDCYALNVELESTRYVFVSR